MTIVFDFFRSAPIRRKFPRSDNYNFPSSLSLQTVLSIYTHDDTKPTIFKLPSGFSPANSFPRILSSYVLAYLLQPLWPTSYGHRNIIGADVLRATLRKLRIVLPSRKRKKERERVRKKEKDKKYAKRETDQKEKRRDTGSSKSEGNREK